MMNKEVIKKIANEVVKKKELTRMDLSGISIFTIKRHLRKFRDETGCQVICRRSGEGFKFTLRTSIWKVRELREAFEKIFMGARKLIIAEGDVNIATLRVEASRFNNKKGGVFIKVKTSNTMEGKSFEIYNPNNGEAKEQSMNTFLSLDDITLTFCRKLIAEKLASLTIPCDVDDASEVRLKIAELNKKLPDGGKMIFSTATRRDKFVGIEIRMEDFRDPWMDMIDKEEMV